MWSDVLDAIALLIRVLTPFFPSLVAFALGWGLFEVTERRKAAMRKSGIRRALIAELQQVEAILSSIVWKFAMGAADPIDGVGELRWFLAHARERGAAVEDPPEQLVALAARSDDELIRAFRGYRPTRELGLTMLLPIVDSVLANPDGGLTPTEWQRMGQIRWQSHLLEFVTADMREWLRFSFTVTDPTNHGIVEANYQNARMWYAKRAKHMLDVVRDGLRTLGA